MRRHAGYAALILVGTLISAAAFAGAFPRLNGAEGNLRVALRELRAAPAIYHGHKRNAENLIVQAMQELQAAKVSVR